MDPQEISVGVVGLGLMGCSITTCLLIAGHPVVAVAPIASDLIHAESRVCNHLKHSFENGLVANGPEFYIDQLTITEDYAQLSGCKLVIECTIENIAIKESVFKKVEQVIASDAVLASNTSAIPISTLQKLTIHPDRFFGLHWAEPAHTTRFLEIICGDESDKSKGEYLYELSHLWSKEPILVRKDIPGFITNRLMYAMYREAISLVENGYATVEDVDRSCRNNAGYFMTLMGVFRWMDLTGVAAYHTVMKDLLPTLDNSTHVPKLIDDIVKVGGNGVSNAHGFYEYAPGEARLWEDTFTAFSYEIRELALKYPHDVVKQKLPKEPDL
ncbi:3-hydroxyacyl-CoA dehydrogenase family protein [Dyadobacter sp. CY327]|uniref:3-hydroxyacyl-CoA dehydrogenase family protein n=1 Tax=Dyadobacter sp. CY327 TaxID=2907301 RepID=UPI001F22CF05|nr:3-hydroxyacyl-CoA dehydrogenase family protein [Dyadobacter sp. CY327]MCE7070127.1 3-hydroxyacyl-CoA dehydrogenase family protein [Dyadobacter sp. CY327]